MTGIKLIKHNAAGVFNADDPSFPFKLEASFSPPSFMAFTFVTIHGGSEDIVVRGMTQEALERFVDENSLRSHPRIRSLTITGPDVSPSERAQAEARGLSHRYSALGRAV